MAYVYDGSYLTIYMDGEVKNTAISGNTTSNIAACEIYPANILLEKRTVAKLKTSAAKANLKCILVSLTLCYSPSHT